MDSPSSADNSSRMSDRPRLVACRECRRSKIRCSRTFPCDACTRRGCTDICPDGIKATKRSKSDENLLHENARLVRRIRRLEGILLSLKHPAALSDDMFHDPPSPGQESQSSEKVPSSDMSEPPIGETFNLTHDRDVNSASLVPTRPQMITGNRDYSHPSRIDPELGNDPMTALESHLRRNKAILAPGCQFALRALLELCRSCGVIDAHCSSDKNTPPDLTEPKSHTSLFSSPSPLSPSSPSSCGPASETPALPSDTNISTGDPTSTAEHVSWDLPEMMPTLPSSSFGDRVEMTSLQIQSQFGESLLQSTQQNVGYNEPMTSELCHRLLLELGLVQEKDWRPSNGMM